MLVVVGAAVIVLNLGRYYRRISIGIGRQMGKVPRLARYRYRLRPGPRSSLFGACASYRKSVHGPSIWPSI